jgi:glycosyltransferase involved in cell wall biosynthesis
VPVNRGQGAALRLGYLLARRGGAQFIATTDADGQYEAADLDRVLAPLVEGRADFVSGSRVLGSALTSDRTRLAGVTLFAGVISLVTGRRITDPANGLRAMRAEVAAAVRLEQPQYQAAELLIGAIAARARVAEVPTTMRERTAGTTKKGRNLAYGVRFGRVVLGTLWRERGARPSPAKTTSS